MKESGKKIFIFTCAYNGKSYISRLFDAMLKQTNSNFIHYIYNDGSSDDIDTIVEEYIKKASLKKCPFKVYYEKCKVNKGSLFSTEHCMKKSLEFRDCEYFGWMNCDDWPEPNYIEVLLKYSKSNKYDLISTNLYYHILKEDGRVVYARNFYSKKSLLLLHKMSLSSFFSNSYKFGHFIVKKQSLILINKKFNLELNPIDQTFYNDVQVNLLFLANKSKIKYIKYPCSNFLSRKNALSYDLGFNVFRVSCYNTMEEFFKQYPHSSFKKFSEIFSSLNVFGLIKESKYTISKKVIFRKTLKAIIYNLKNFKNHQPIYNFIFIIVYLIIPKFISAKIMNKTK